MHQQPKKALNQQAGAKQQTGQPNTGNVWDFNQFKQGTEAWNKAWKEMLAHNANSEEWSQTYKDGNKNLSSQMNAWNQLTNTISEANTGHYQACMQKWSQEQSQWYNHANDHTALSNKMLNQYNHMCQKSFSCRTMEQCANWAQGCANDSQEMWGEYCANYAQRALDCQKNLYQPMMQQAFNWQDRCMKAWAKYTQNCCVS